MSFLSDFKVALLGNCVVLYVSITTNYKTGSKYLLQWEIALPQSWSLCFGFHDVAFLLSFLNYPNF